MVFLDCGDLLAELTYTMDSHWCDMRSIHVMRTIGIFVLPIFVDQFGDFV